MRGLLRLFVENHGSQYLIRHKSLAFTQQTVQALCNFVSELSRHSVGRRRIGSSPYWLTIQAIWAVLSQSGLRKDEVSEKAADPWTKAKPSRAAIQWMLPGERIPRSIWDPEELKALPWGSTLYLTPPPSKCDPFGIIWGVHPILLPLEEHAPICAARALRDMCVAAPCSQEEQEDTPLFFDPS